MTRRTYQQAQTWRAAAVALLAEVGVEVSPNPSNGAKTPHDVATGEQKIISGRGQIVTYLSGKVSIGGPAADADYLCEPLERHGLLNGWHPGSRGSGVVWVPQPAKVEEALAIAACTAAVTPRKAQASPITGASMVTAEEVRRVAAHLQGGSRSIALAELPHADAFAVDALAFEVRKFADLLEREAERLPSRPAARGCFAPGDRVFVQGGRAGTIRHDAGGVFVSVHFDGTHGPTSYPRVALQRETNA